jgi:hypothetical protein
MRLGANQHTIAAMCVTWTALAPSGNITFDLIVYDTTGAGGQPGNFVTRVNGVVGNAVGIFPLHSRYRYAVSWSLPQNAYYVGVRWNNNPILPFFISSDENSATLGTGYNRNTTTFPPVWNLTTTGFPNFKWHGIRLEAAPPADTRCRNGLNIVIPALGSANPDSVHVGLGLGCLVTDVDVRIDTVIHTWDSDLLFYLRKGTVGVRIINQVGGSGDNFIRTVLDDAAANPITSGVAPFTGTFRPSNPLTPFNGQITDGYWRLHINDTVAGDSGFLRAWCVVVGFNCPIGGIGTIEVPNHYILKQNYPNPFNPSTTIKFGIPRSEVVKLVVYDILGREVRTLVNEMKTSGTYEVTFDASMLSSGVYFYKLETPSFSETKRMLLVK